MGITAKNSYRIREMEVITTYLYRFLDKEIYIIQLYIFEDRNIRVCSLKKALYDLKLSRRVWYQILFDFLKKLNFHKIESDPSLFPSADKTILISVQVDDLFFFAPDINFQIEDVMQNFQDRFHMTDLDDDSYYPLMEVDEDFNKKTITLWQSIYLKKILGRYGINNCRPAKFPIRNRVVNSFSSYHD